MTVQQIIELLRGYMVERVPLSLPSLLNTLVIHNVTYRYNSDSIRSGDYYTGYSASIVIEDFSGRYTVVIMNDKVVSIEFREAPKSNILLNFDDLF